MTKPVDESLVIYWRPLCGFCQRLLEALEVAGIRATLCNIWDDPEAAAFVRTVNNGVETVPTVVVDGIVYTNPPPDQLVAHLQQA
ncbi:MAG: glutaredoxin domain-containing protein [Actinomycetota bacterium]|nr:glutaredoxin domain-containing protein [Actinomycetota bacterium]